MVVDLAELKVREPVALGTRGPIVGVPQSEVLALVEAVEAGHALFGFEPSDDADADGEALVAILARYEVALKPFVHPGGH